MNCVDAIFFQADLAPEKVAVVAPDAVTSYARFANGVASAERRLAAARLGEGHVVGLDIAHPIDHLVFACALYRMKVASVSIPATTAALPEGLGLEAVLADNIDTVNRAPVARIIFVDTSWFLDKVEWTVGARAHARRGPGEWLCRATLSRGGSVTAKITAAQLEAHLLDYMLALGSDWERMIAVADLSSHSGLTLALSALSQGRTVCLANAAVARELILTYRHHYLVASTDEVASILAKQKTDFMPLPALKGVFIEGSAFSRSLLEACMTALSPNTTIAYRHPEAGIVAFGGAGRLKETPGAVGYIAPWAEVEIMRTEGTAGEGVEGELRLRRRAAPGAPSSEWMLPRQKARRLKHNLLVVAEPRAPA